MRPVQQGSQVGPVLRLDSIAPHIEISEIKVTAHSGDLSLGVSAERVADFSALSEVSRGTPVHIHPHATESYEVLEGKLDLYVDGTWRTLSAGEKASVDPGVAHTFRNASDSRTRVYNTHAPAMRYGEYFESLHRVVHSGVIRDGQITPKAILYMSVLMTSFKDEIRSVSPPHAVMRVFALVGKLLGYRV